MFLVLWAIVRLNWDDVGMHHGTGYGLKKWMLYLVSLILFQLTKLTHPQSRDKPCCFPIMIELQDLKGSPNFQTCNSNNPLWFWCLGLFTPYSLLPCCLPLPSGSGIAVSGLFQNTDRNTTQLNKPSSFPNFGFGFIHMILNSCPLPLCQAYKDSLNMSSKGILQHYSKLALEKRCK